MLHSRKGFHTRCLFFPLCFYEIIRQKDFVGTQALRRQLFRRRIQGSGPDFRIIIRRHRIQTSSKFKAVEVPFYGWNFHRKFLSSCLIQLIQSLIWPQMKVQTRFRFHVLHGLSTWLCFRLSDLLIPLIITKIRSIYLLIYILNL